MTSRPIDQVQKAEPAEKKEAKPQPNLFGLAATLASGIALTLTLLGSGVSYALEAEFGLPHASIFESALDLTDLSGYAIAQLLNHGSSTLADWSLYKNLYSRGWPMIAFGIAASLLMAGFAWWWGRSPRKPAAPQPEQDKLPDETPAKKLRRMAFVLAAVFPAMPLIGAAMIAVICVLCVLVAFAPMVGMLAGQSYIKEWVVDPEICVPELTRERRMQLRSGQVDSSKGPKASSCVVILKDGVEIARGRVIFMTTKSAALFDPTTGAVRRVPLGTNVVQIVSKLDFPALSAAPISSVAMGAGSNTRPASAPAAPLVARHASSAAQLRR